MRILFASSEVAPFIKTGGLADVAGSLPKALAQEGHDVKVILPLYEGIGEQWRSQMNVLSSITTSLCRGGTCTAVSSPWSRTASPTGSWTTSITSNAGSCTATLMTVSALPTSPGPSSRRRATSDWAPDIIHCNDWQTALVPVYLLEERYHVPELANTKTVFTIHNIEYQGRYGDQVLEDVIGLDRSYLNEGMLGYYKDVNLMKGAIMASNFVTTVSPTYAQELRTALLCPRLGRSH